MFGAVEAHSFDVGGGTSRRCAHGTQINSSCDGDGAVGNGDGNGGTVTAVADTAGPFGPSLGGRINASDVIAFHARFDAGGSGIFVGPDPVADKVIATGDALFGSNVAGIEGLGGMNDAGQLVFEYTLANGIRGVALATPVPEPAAASAIVLGALVTTTRRWRATPHQPALVRADV